MGNVNRTYIGKIINGKKHDIGKLIIKYGEQEDIYDGFFDNDRFINGVIKTNNVEITGIFENDVFNRGKIETSKFIYKGKFDDVCLKNFGCEMIFFDEAEIEIIEGKIFDKESKLLMVGEFKKNYLIKGKKILPSGQIHEGEFENGYLIKGKCILPSGQIHEGEFENNYLIKGKEILPSGQIEEGEFENYLIKGKIILPSGQIYEGEFENGSLIKGKKIFPDGQIEKIEYINNNSIKEKISKNKINIMPPKKLETNNKSEETLCVICLEHEKKMTFDCGHFCVCEKCGPKLNACPLCRKKGKCFKIYFS